MRWYHLVAGIVGIIGVLWDVADILNTAIGFSVFVTTGQLPPQSTDSAVREALLRWAIIGLPSVFLIYWGFIKQKRRYNKK